MFISNIFKFVLSTTFIMSKVLASTNIPPKHHFPFIVEGTDPIYPKAKAGGRMAFNVKFMLVESLKNERAKFELTGMFCYTDEEFVYGHGIESHYVDVKKKDERTTYVFDTPIDEFKLLSLILLGRVTPAEGYRALHTKHQTNYDIVRDKNDNRVDDWEEKYYSAPRSQRKQMWYEFDRTYCPSKLKDKDRDGPSFGMLLDWINHKDRNTPLVKLDSGFEVMEWFSNFVGNKIELDKIERDPKPTVELSGVCVQIKVFAGDLFETVDLNECKTHERQVANLLLGCSFAREISIGTFNLGGCTTVRKIGPITHYTEQDLKVWGGILETYVKTTDIADQNYAIDLATDNGYNIKVRRSGVTCTMQPVEEK